MTTTTTTTTAPDVAALLSGDQPLSAADVDALIAAGRSAAAEAEQSKAAAESAEDIIKVQRQALSDANSARRKAIAVVAPIAWTLTQGPRKVRGAGKRLQAGWAVSATTVSHYATAYGITRALGGKPSDAPRILASVVEPLKAPERDRVVADAIKAESGVTGLLETIATPDPKRGDRMTRPAAATTIKRATALADAIKGGLTYAVDAETAAGQRAELIRVLESALKAARK